MVKCINFEISGRIEAENKKDAEKLLREYLDKKTIESLYIEFLEVD